MESVHVVIEGLTSLLMKSAASMLPGPQSPPNGGTKVERDAVLSPAEKMEVACYRFPDGSIGFPGTALQRCIRDAAVGLKLVDTAELGERVKAKTKNQAAPGQIKGRYQVDPLDLIALTREGQPICAYVPDVRTIVAKVGQKQHRLVEYRPKIELPWEMRFNILLDMQYAPVGNFDEVILGILDRGGTSIGIGSFRPQNGGWFGKFRVKL